MLSQVNIKRQQNIQIEPDTCYYLSSDEQPKLEVELSEETFITRNFTRIGPWRESGEYLYAVSLAGLPIEAEWSFRIETSSKTYLQPQSGSLFKTRLRSLWVQDGQVFGYKPAAKVSPSQVIKIPEFTGSLPTRPLYIYLPRGYREHTWKRYPVLYMHDGQNAFETHTLDSYVGSWRADETADHLIANGLMSECIIVGVSNGGKSRFVEYLPPYITHLPFIQEKANPGQHPVIQPLVGRADQAFAYYQEDVQPYINRKYRTRQEREYTATCGSSMGGLFSMYIAWDQPEFARHHAVVSPAFVLTRNQEGTLEMVERMRTEEPRDLRIWLDSGTRTSDHYGNDDMYNTQAARDALIENGYVPGGNLVYYLHQDAIHHETDWAQRLPLILKFLFPIENEQDA